MLRWMTGIKGLEMIMNEEIRARAGVANKSEKMWTYSFTQLFTEYHGELIHRLLLRLYRNCRVALV